MSMMVRLFLMKAAIVVVAYFHPTSQFWGYAGQEDNSKSIIEKHRFKIAPISSNRGALAYSNDGKVLAARDKESLIIWEAESGKERLRIPSPQGFGNVIFTPNNDLVIDISAGMVRKVNVQTGEVVSSVRLELRERVLGYLPGGKEMVYFSKGLVQIRDADGLKVMRDFRIEPDRPSEHGTLCLSQDGRRLVYFDLVKRLGNLWDVESGERIAKLSGHEDTIRSVCFSRSGKLLASASFDSVRIWDAKSGKEIHKLTRKGNLLEVAFSPGGNRLAVGWRDVHSRISLFDSETGNELVTWQTDETSSKTLAFSPKGDLLASSGNRVLHVWDLTKVEWPPVKGKPVERKETKAEKKPASEKKLPPEIKSPDKEPAMLTARELTVYRNVNDDPRFVGFGSDDKAIIMATGAHSFKRFISSWNIKDGSENWALSDQPIGRPKEKTKFHYTLSPDGSILVESGYHWLHVMDAANGNTLRFTKYDKFDMMLADPFRRLAKIAFRAQSTQFARASQSQIVFMERKPDGKIKQTGFVIGWGKPKVHKFEDGDLSPDLERIAFPVANYQIRVAEIASEKTICTMEAESVRIENVAYSPCGRWIISFGGFLGKDTVIWDANTGKELSRLDYRKHLSNYAFSRDGKWLATGTGHGGKSEVVVWSLPTCKKLLTLEIGSGSVAVAFNQKGDMLTAASRDACYVWALK